MGIKISSKAQHAIQAAQNRGAWGRRVVRAFLIKHDISNRLYHVACKLDSAGYKVDQVRVGGRLKLALVPKESKHSRSY